MKFTSITTDGTGEVPQNTPRLPDDRHIYETFDVSGHVKYPPKRSDVVEGEIGPSRFGSTPVESTRVTRVEVSNISPTKGLRDKGSLSTPLVTKPFRDDRVSPSWS